MTVLALAANLPPTLNPQSIQIGRLLYAFEEKNPVYVANAVWNTPLRCDAYEEWKNIAADVVQVRQVQSYPWFGALRRLAPFFLQNPDPSWIDLYRLEKRVRHCWSGIDFDWIISFAYPFSSHISALRLKKYFKSPWIAHFSDPWADNPVLGYGKLSNLINRISERTVIENADLLVFVSFELAAYYEQRYPHARSRIRVMEHCFDETAFESSPHKASKFLCVRYIGNLYGGRSFETFFKALQILKLQEQQIQCELVLAYTRNLRPLIDKYGLTDIVRIINPAHYRDSLRLMTTADVLVTMDIPLPGQEENIFFPSKLADYMGSYRPVLGIVGRGATRRIIEGYGGWVVSPENSMAAAIILKQLIAQKTAFQLLPFTPNKEFRSRYNITTRIKEWDVLMQ